MVFSSSVFLFLFLPFVLMIYYLLDRRFRNVFLLIASLFFYAWGEPKFVLVMMGSTLVNWLSALMIQRRKEMGHADSAKWVKIFAIFLNLGLLFIFGYLNFTIKNINRLASLLGYAGALVPLTHIIQPIGLSFFTFQSMSYIFDVYNGKCDALKNPFDMGLYIAFFPQLIAGPIVRYPTIDRDLKDRHESTSNFAQGVERFIIGLFKKAVFANTLAMAVVAAFETLSAGRLTVGYAWLGGIAYSLQIYFDFSGYSDMAIGLGMMFGFHFLENFDHPYMSATVSEFWRRWHISLGSWFRDYVYFPLGGSRVPQGRLVLNLLIVWGLTGIWHGANWTFIAWGLMYFVLLSVEKLTGVDKYLIRHKFAAVIYRLFTLVCVICGWVMFRAEGFSIGARFIAAMFGFSPNGFWSGLTGSMWGQYAVLVTLAVLCCVEWKAILPDKWIRVFCGEEISAPVFVGRVVVYAIIAIVGISFTVASTYNPFIYFKF